MIPIWYNKFLKFIDFLEYYLFFNIKLFNLSLINLKGNNKGQNNNQDKNKNKNKANGNGNDKDNDKESNSINIKRVSNNNFTSSFSSTSSTSSTSTSSSYNNNKDNEGNNFKNFKEIKSQSNEIFDLFLKKSKNNLEIISLIFEIIRFIELVCYNEETKFKYLLKKKKMNLIFLQLSNFMLISLNSNRYSEAFKFQKKLIINQLPIMNNNKMKKMIIFFNIYILIYSKKKIQKINNFDENEKKKINALYNDQLIDLICFDYHFFSQLTKSKLINKKITFPKNKEDFENFYNSNNWPIFFNNIILMAISKRTQNFKKTIFELNIQYQFFHKDLINIFIQYLENFSKKKSPQKIKFKSKSGKKYLKTNGSHSKINNNIQKIKKKKSKAKSISNINDDLKQNKKNKNDFNGLNYMDKFNGLEEENDSIKKFLSLHNKIEQKIYRNQQKIILLEKNYTNNLNYAKRKYKQIIRSLTNERGPWNEIGNYSNNNLEIHWKLDTVENGKRERMRLKRNYSFDYHKKASILRDYGDVKESRKKLNELKLIQKKKLNKRILNKTVSGIDLLLENNNQLNNHSIKEKSKLQKKSYNNDDNNNNHSHSHNHNHNHNLNSNHGRNHSHNQKEVIIFETKVELKKPFKITSGVFKICNNSIQFFGKSLIGNETNESNEMDNQFESNIDKKSKTKKKMTRDHIWPLNQLIQIYKRRYRLRQSAIEIFLKNKKIYFLKFDHKVRDKIFELIISLKPPNLTNVFFSVPSEHIKKKNNLIKKWQNYEISNFEYLMQLNSLAGRTYNDLSQYPVFPWVLTDYKSKKIDLNNTKVYRDLSRPVGLLNPNNAEKLEIKYKELANNPETGIPPFHYGSHYSNAGIILYYLIRMEPFTTMAIEFQGGNFDAADRQFSSIEQAYNNSCLSLVDVKELIPEFYYLPEFLLNLNKIDLGIRDSDKKKVDDVKLPPWANGDPYEFVRIMRRALESDYVSEHLNEWIDLIFGYKQQGIEAVKSMNVFYYLTYEDEIKKLDLDNIENIALQASIESQIENFGQTPIKLFDKPHPKRRTKNLFNYYDALSESLFKNINPPTFFINDSPVIYSKMLILEYEVFGLSSNLLIFDQSRKLQYYAFSTIADSKTGNPKFLIHDNLNNNDKFSKRIGLPFANGISKYCNLLTTGLNDTLLFTCGYWDYSFRITSLNTFNQIIKITDHKDVVTCINCCDKIFVTGSRDTTVMIWEIFQESKKQQRIRYKCNHILFGHDDEVTCIDLNIDLDLVISGSKDQTIIVHTLESGRYIRSIKTRTPKLLKILSNGYLLVYCSGRLLTLFSINGKRLKQAWLNYGLVDLCVSRDNQYLFTGDKRGFVTIRNLYTFKEINKMEFPKPISSISLSNSNNSICIGLKNGKVALAQFKSSENN
ncbi:beige/beach-related [Anaeramoeba flamelloides]|uniref:Beige/beach-related n=1 Tax=Anaeramoeba flamelloides TaxID=1746091 RepID=A0AAV7YK16_9EUKA|nr:beige/beach-related [Anaeramoeba flamelloides]